ncbi:MAG: DsbA family protein [Pseudomonadota bacterium]
MSDIRVYAGVRSPYSRLGMHVLKRAGLNPDVWPFTGPPDGAVFQNPTDNQLKLAYIMQDAPRLAQRMGLAMTRPENPDPDFGPSHLAQLAATRDGVGLGYACAIADARWGEGKDVGDLNVLCACADAIGWSAQAVKTAVDDGLANLFDHHRALIKKDGVFGVPFAVLDTNKRPQKFWGHERFELLVESVNTG